MAVTEESIKRDSRPSADREYVERASVAALSRGFAAVVDPTGAAGNYSTLQEAIDFVNNLGGGSILVKSGQYSLSQTVTMYSNVHLIGEGTNTELVGSDLSDTSAFEFFGTLRSNTGTFAINKDTSTITGTGTTLSDDNVVEDDLILIEGVAYTIDSVASNTSATIKEIFRGQNVSGDSILIYEPLVNSSISHMLIRDYVNTSDIIFFKRVHGVKAEGLVFRNCDCAHLIDVNVFSGVQIVGNRLIDKRSAFYNGIGFTYGANAIIIGNDIASSSNRGIYLQNVDSFTITNNLISHNAAEGISLDGPSDNISIIGNRILNNDDDGILITEGQTINIAISGNIIRGNAGDGIKLFDGGSNTKIRNTAINGNVIVDNGEWGIEITGSDVQRTYIGPNVIFNNTSGEISDSGTDTVIINPTEDGDGNVDLHNPQSLQEQSNTPSNPDDGTEVRMYMKADKIIFQFNDGGTVRYKYLTLSGTGVTWTHTTSAP